MAGGEREQQLIVVSLDTAGLPAAVREAGAGQVRVVAHVHRHALLDPLRLHHHVPRACSSGTKTQVSDNVRTSALRGKPLKV